MIHAESCYRNSCIPHSSTQNCYLFINSEILTLVFLSNLSDLPQRSIGKVQCNLQIIHVTVELFQSYIVRRAEVLPQIGIFFFELPKVRKRLTTSCKEKGLKRGHNF